MREEQEDRFAHHLARLTKRKGLAPLGAIPTFKVAERIGAPTHRLDQLGAYHEGEECAHFPRMYRFGHRWFSFEADIAAFLERRSHFEGLMQKGWLDTRAAAARIGVTCATLIRECRESGLKPEHFGHHALYSPQDLETIKWIRESRETQAKARKREIAAMRLALRQQQAKERKKSERQERIVLVDGIPETGVPMRQVLLRIGMSRRRFEKIKQGLSGTPIPRYHRAPNGHLYCLSNELSAFLADPQANRMAIVRRQRTAADRGR